LQESTFNASLTGPIHFPTNDRPIVVEVDNVRKTFGSREAVKGISFTIGQGEIFGLLGPNGAGKSTTINMMCGYLEPTGGDTRIAGLSITKQPRKVKRTIGVVPQEIALYKDLTSMENLGFSVRSTVYPPGSAKRVPKRSSPLSDYTSAATSQSRTSPVACSDESIWPLP
jgi:ABC-2 type transport system ATP-binding protein